MTAPHPQALGSVSNWVPHGSLPAVDGVERRYTGNKASLGTIHHSSVESAHSVASHLLGCRIFSCMTTPERYLLPEAQMREWQKLPHTRSYLAVMHRCHAALPQLVIEKVPLKRNLFQMSTVGIKPTASAPKAGIIPLDQWYMMYPSSNDPCLQ